MLSFVLDSGALFVRKRTDTRDRDVGRDVGQRVNGKDEKERAVPDGKAHEVDADVDESEVGSRTERDRAVRRTEHKTVGKLQVRALARLVDQGGERGVASREEDEAGTLDQHGPDVDPPDV